MAPSSPVLATSTSVEIRSATDADWPAISLLDATSFGVHSKDSELTHRIDAAFVSDVPAQLGFGF